MLVQSSGECETETAQAVDAGSIEIAKLLLDSGADPNAYGRSSKFPLYLAAKNQSPDSVDILKLLIERRAEVNLKYVNGMFQCSHSHKLTFELFIICYENRNYFCVPGTCLFSRLT